MVLLRDLDSDAVCVLSWRGRKLRRIVTSPSAAETLASNEGVSEVIFIKTLLGEYFGVDNAIKIPVHLYTDSRNLQKSVNSTAMVDCPRLRTEIAVLKESLEKGEVDVLKRVESKEMIANCLTKQGASAKGLLQVIQTGHMKPVVSK